MPPITETQFNDRFVNGVLVESNPVVVDITTKVVQLDLHAKARNAIDANVAFLALANPTNAETLAQVRTLTRECTALIRLLIGDDLLNDTEGT